MLRTLGARTVGALAAFALGACVATPDEGGGRPPVDVGTVPGHDAGAPPMGDGSTPGAPPTLELGPIPALTYWSVVPISGQGPPGGTLLVETSGRGPVSTSISLSGTFCVDVPLSASRANQLTFQAIDTAGQYSEVVTAEVTQEGSPPEPEPAIVEPTNVARGGGVERMSVDVDVGDVAAITDGNPGTYVRVYNVYGEDWLILRLRERANLNRMRVLSGTGCVMNEYKVMVSDADSPTDAVDGNERWQLVAHVTPDRAEAEKALDFEPVVGRFVGVQFLSTDCEGWYGRGFHEIREIEAWSAPLATAPAPAPEAPSCMSGGALD